MAQMLVCSVSRNIHTSSQPLIAVYVVHNKTEYDLFLITVLEHVIVTFGSHTKSVVAICAALQ